MSIAGHVPRAMLLRSSHVRVEAKRRALDEIAVRQRAADEKREAEGEGPEQATISKTTLGLVIACRASICRPYP